MQTSLQFDYSAKPPIRFFCVLCGTALEAAADSHHDLTECHSCSRCVPVPRPTNLRGKFLNTQPVLPPGVLELSVTFHCTTCSSRLRTDARWEGREIYCPDCRGKTKVPRWSTIPFWSRPGVPEEKLPERTPAKINSDAAVLSAEEIEFLRGALPDAPGTAA